MADSPVTGDGRRPVVVVLDYGAGNLRSAERALHRAGGDVTVTADPDRAAAADGLVVPGVGAFAACMAGLHRVGAGPLVAERVADGLPVLGICVGAQVMFEAGEEHGLRTAGLGLLPGTVTRLAAARVPHMGWNTVAVPGDSRLGMRDGDRFYFVHSYAAQDVAGLRAAGAAVTTCRHDVAFAAAVERGPLAVTQFHPEKSGDAGAALLRTWVAGLAPASALSRAARRSRR